MKKFIISLGKIDKKLFWVFSFALVQVIINLLSYYYPTEKTYQIMDSYSICFGQMLVILIPRLFGYKEKIIKKDEICTKKNLKYQGLLWLLNLLLYGSISVNSFSDSSTVTTPHNTILCTKEAIEIILLIIITRIILKYKYYIHHLISLIIFCILCFFIDFLLQNFQEGLLNRKPMKIILDCVSLIIEIVNFCYTCYMLNNLYYHYWTISFSLGLFLFVLNTSVLILIVAFLGDPNGDRNFFNNFYYFFAEVSPGWIILRFFSWLIAYGGSQLLRLLVLEKLTPNHMLISYEISKLSNVLILSDSDNRWYSIILFVLQFISLLFFLEILEFNFCNLNLNTKKSIQERETTTMVMRESVGSVCSAAEMAGYIVKNENNENVHSLKEMNLLDKVEIEETPDY